MPGMMDTVLNLGLNDRTIQGLIRKTNNERFAYDAYRRVIAMFSTVVMDLKREQFGELLTEKKAATRARHGTDRTAEAWEGRVPHSKRLVLEETGPGFPHEQREQRV